MTIISLERLPQKTQGRSCPPPRGFPPDPKARHQIGNHPNQTGSFFTWLTGAPGSEGCSEGVSSQAQAN